MWFFRALDTIRICINGTSKTLRFVNVILLGVCHAIRCLQNGGSHLFLICYNSIWLTWCVTPWKLQSTQMIFMKITKVNEFSYPWFEIQCGAVLTWQFFFQKFNKKTPHSSPVRPTNEVYFLWPNSDLYSASVTTVVCEISCNIGPRYNGIRLYSVIIIVNNEKNERMGLRLSKYITRLSMNHGSQPIRKTLIKKLTHNTMTRLHPLCVSLFAIFINS